MMLVLTRKPGERILIPGVGVSFTLIKIQGNQARIGIDAPPQADIVREEIAGAAVYGSLLCNDQTMNHDTRNRVNSLALNIALLDKMVDDHSLSAEANRVLAAIKKDVGLLSKQAALPPPLPVLSGRLLKTLIVEDDLSNRQGMTAILRLAGVPVDSTPTAEDAIDMLDTGRYEAVLLDMGLGGRMDGESVIRHIQRMESRPKVYITSAQANKNRFQVDGWFQKPYDPNTVLKYLRES